MATTRGTQTLSTAHILLLLRCIDGDDAKKTSIEVEPKDTASKQFPSWSRHLFKQMIFWADLIMILAPLRYNKFKTCPNLHRETLMFFFPGGPTTQVGVYVMSGETIAHAGCERYFPFNLIKLKPDKLFFRVFNVS